MDFFLFILVLLLGISAFFYVFRKRKCCPGPPGLPFFGEAFRLMFLQEKDILPLINQWFVDYGRIVQVEMLGNVYVLLSEPEEVEAVLSSTVHINKGHWEYSFFRPWLNDGLLLSSGDKWRSRRKLLTSSFHFKILDRHLEGICRYAETYAESLMERQGEEVNIEEMVRLLSLKIICETAMGVKLNTDDQEQNSYVRATKNASKGIVSRYMKFWLYPNFIYRRSEEGKKFFKSIHTMQTFAKKVISKRKLFFGSEENEETKGNKKIRKAFLDLLLEFDAANPGIINDAGIREEVDTFMFEGHDTVSAALAFAHFLLASHQTVQEKAFEEQLEIFGTDRRRPTMADLQKMTYLEMVIKETLRLYPSVPFHTRLLYEDLRIDENTVVPAGYSVGIINFNVHRSKRHWVDPELFIPERFADQNRHPFAYIPFSAGPRNCIGQKLAMLEMKGVLSTLLRNFKLEAVSTEVIPVASVIIRCLNPIYIKVYPHKVTEKS